jgi:glycosyltransferase involved in cell wall biosynthesis
VEVCTIIAKNYVAHARVLARSLADHNPDSRLWTLIVDDYESYIDPAQEPFEVLSAADVGCEPFVHMALSYSVLELSTAVKPWLLRHLLAGTGRPVTYLDPDIKVYGSLGPLDDLAARHGVVLIPHNSEPIPLDGRKPAQIDIMLAGIYNLGYVSLAPGAEVDRLLSWWAERLRYDCRVAPAGGFFVDQRWFDLAPGFLSDIAIVREPEYNVAYWNVHSRTLERVNGAYQVDGRPLRFFHFSGFDPAHPLRLSRHQDRIDVTSHPVLEGLLAEYAGEVRSEGHDVSRKWPYSYLALADGTKIDDGIRALFVEFDDEQHRDGDHSPSPFTLQGASVFKAWLSGQAPGAPIGISRALAGTHAARPDLQLAYPSLANGDAERLLRWAEQHGRHESQLLAWTMDTGDHSTPGPPERPADSQPAVTAEQEPFALRQMPWGVNVLQCSEGVAEVEDAANLILHALDLERITAVPVGTVTPATRSWVKPRDAPFAVNVLSLAPGTMFDLGGQLGDELFGGRYSVGLWFWAAEQLPEGFARLSLPVEELWAPSRHVARALEALSSVPVTTIPISAQPLTTVKYPRSQLGLSDRTFTVGASLDYVSGFERQNALAVVRAFRSAFSGSDDARLVLACVNAERDPRRHAQLLAAVEEEPAIELRDGPHAAADATALTVACDCYISLHRAEAFGLGLATAMWNGKPVIATGYSGNLDFMNADNSMLVDYKLSAIGPDADPYPVTGMWAEASVEHATTFLRRLFAEPALAHQLGTRAAQEIRVTRSLQATGEAISRRLEAIHATGRPRRNRAGDERSPAVVQISRRLQDGPYGTTPKEGLRRLARRAMLRLMRPFTAYQHVLDAEFVAALDEVDRKISDLRRELRAGQAELLAELRRGEEGFDSSQSSDAQASVRRDPGDG